MLLSIVIPTHNRSSNLKEALSVLSKNLNLQSDVDVHVIDDFSDPLQRKANVSVCDEYSANYHFNNRNRGPAFARNVGIKVAKGKWIAFLDDDVTVDEDWFFNVKSALSQAENKVLGFEGITKALGKGLWDNEVENLNGGLYLSCNSIYRKDILQNLKGFDESFYGPFAEDHELALRIKKWGEIVFEKRIIVYHMPRHINYIHYFRGSFSRMRSLLDAEYHFYMKHRDRYHTFRHAATFWEVLLNILLKHSVTTFKRRKILKLLFHPFQTCILAASSLYEQTVAWVLSVTYIKRYIYQKPDNHFKDINKKATAVLWKFKKDTYSDLLTFNPGIIRSLLFCLHRKPVYNALTILKRVRLHTRSRNPRVFLRIDDLFLQDIKSVRLFCDIMEQIDISFLAGVTGKDFINTDYNQVLRRITSAGGAIGIHGFYHTGQYGPYSSELLQLTYPEFDVLVNDIIEAPVYAEIKPVAFIPPFNAISWEQVVYLSNKFPVICGGPESARFTNYSYGPVVLTTGGVYFPSYYPFYDCSVNMLNSVFIRNIVKSKSPICITVHLYNEIEDDFASLQKLMNVLKSAITDWSHLCTNSQFSPDALKELSE